MARRSARKPAEWTRPGVARLDVFERALQKAGTWIDVLVGRLGWDDRHQAYEALGVVLHTLRDRLPLEEAVAFGGQLPLLLRGLYYQNWDVSVKPQKYRHAREFLSRVRGGLLEHRLEFIPEERVALAVAGVLLERLSPGELMSLRRALPPEIRTFFDLGPSPDTARRWLAEERAWDQSAEGS